MYFLVRRTANGSAGVLTDNHLRRAPRPASPESTVMVMRDRAAAHHPERVIVAAAPSSHRAQ
jgi:hypothetical protein